MSIRSLPVEVIAHHNQLLRFRSNGQFTREQPVERSQLVASGQQSQFRVSSFEFPVKPPRSWRPTGHSSPVLRVGSGEGRVYDLGGGEVTKVTRQVPNAGTCGPGAKKCPHPTSAEWSTQVKFFVARTRPACDPQ